MLLYKYDKFQVPNVQHIDIKEYRLLKSPCLLHWYCKWPQQQKKKRKEEAYPWKAGASSRHITNLRQSILETFDIYGTTAS